MDIVPSKKKKIKTASVSSGPLLNTAKNIEQMIETPSYSPVNTDMVIPQVATDALKIGLFGKLNSQKETITIAPVELYE